MSGYVPLWCKSHYSFLEGASSPEEYVDACRRLGVHAFALTDRDGLYGVVRAHQRAVDVGVQLIIGAEVTLDDGSHIVLSSAINAAISSSARSSPSAAYAPLKEALASRGASSASTPTGSLRSGEVETAPSFAPASAIRRWRKPARLLENTSSPKSAVIGWSWIVRMSSKRARTPSALACLWWAQRRCSTTARYVETFKT